MADDEKKEYLRNPQILINGDSECSSQCAKGLSQVPSSGFLRVPNSDYQLNDGKTSSYVTDDSGLRPVSCDEKGLDDLVSHKASE